MPAKKPATKATRKAGKKVAKKAAKKAAKKVAKKVTKKTAKRPGGSRQNVGEVSKETRRAMIAEAAYYLAEKRNFANGDPVADWLSGEKAVDVLLSKTAR